MISNDALTTLSKVVSTLTKHGEAELASMVNDIVTEQLSQRAATAKRRAAKAGPGRPGRAFAIAAEPGWRATITGAQAAADKVNEYLKSIGQRAGVTGPAIQQAIARNGAWQRLCHTADGTVALTVARADP